MKVIYKSKVDTWLIVLIIVLCLISIIPVVCIDFSISDLCIAIVLCVCIVYSLFCIRYIVDDGFLIVKCGVFQLDKVHVNDIKSIKSTRTFLSAPAASLDRIELILQNRSVVISPKDKLKFVDCLKDSCSHEIEILIE